MANRYPRLPEDDVVAAEMAPIPPEDWDRIQQGMRRRVSGMTPSIKMNKAVPWRRPEERDLGFLLELDPNVDSYQPLPHRVAIMVGSKERYHYPSYEVRSGKRTAIVDAVPGRREKDPDRQRLNRLLAAFYQSRRIAYQAVPSTAIRLEPRLSNARHILDCRSFTVDDRLRDIVVQALSDGTSTTIAGLENMLASELYVGRAVCRMALDGQLSLGLGARTPKEMLVGLRQRRAAR